jgi:hypothetical protein
MELSFVSERTRYEKHGFLLKFKEGKNTSYHSVKLLRRREHEAMCVCSARFGDTARAG